MSSEDMLSGQETESNQLPSGERKPHMDDKVDDWTLFASWSSCS